MYVKSTSGLIWCEIWKLTMARWLAMRMAKPGGTPIAFWEAVRATSTSQASMRNSSPAKVGWSQKDIRPPTLAHTSCGTNAINHYNNVWTVLADGFGKRLNIDKNPGRCINMSQGHHLVGITGNDAASASCLKGEKFVQKRKSPLAEQLNNILHRRTIADGSPSMGNISAIGDQAVVVYYDKLHSFVARSCVPLAKTITKITRVYYQRLVTFLHEIARCHVPTEGA